MASLDEVIFAVDTQDSKLCLELFAKTDTSINVVLPNQYTALTYALFKSNLSLAGKLLDLGADADSFDEHKKNPLYYAVRYNFVDMVQRLLDKGADSSKVINIDRWTPFHLACSLGYLSAAKLMLLDSDAQVSGDV